MFYLELPSLYDPQTMSSPPPLGCYNCHFGAQPYHVAKTLNRRQQNPSQHQGGCCTFRTCRVWADQEGRFCCIGRFLLHGAGGKRCSIATNNHEGESYCEQSVRSTGATITFRHVGRSCCSHLYEASIACLFSLIDNKGDTDVCQHTAWMQCAVPSCSALASPL